MCGQNLAETAKTGAQDEEEGEEEATKEEQVPGKEREEEQEEEKKEQEEAKTTSDPERTHLGLCWEQQRSQTEEAATAETKKNVLGAGR